MNSPIRTWSLRSRLTLGVVILTAIGFFSASLVTQSLLKNYLTKEVDNQLKVITNGTFERIQQSGIAHEVNEGRHGDDGGRPIGKGLGTPLTRIPTSASLTLLDAQGTVIGGIGGDRGGGHLEPGGVEATAQLGDGHHAGGRPADMGGLMLHLEQQTIERLPEGLPAGRTAQPAALAEIEVGETALRARERRGRGRGRQRIGQLEDGRIGRVSLRPAGMRIGRVHARGNPIWPLQERLDTCVQYI